MVKAWLISVSLMVCLSANILGFTNMSAILDNVNSTNIIGIVKNIGNKTECEWRLW